MSRLHRIWTSHRYYNSKNPKPQSGKYAWIAYRFLSMKLFVFINADTLTSQQQKCTQLPMQK